MGILTDDEKVQNLITRMRDSAFDLDSARANLGFVLRDGAWRQFHTPNGMAVSHSRFLDFVTAEPWEGLGSAVEDLKALAAGDVELLDLLDVALRNPHGGDRRSDAINVNNVNVDRPVGNSEAAALRRLRKDREDLHAEVLAGTLSAHAAMVTAGFRPKTFTVRADNPKSIARTLRRQLSPEVLVALIESLSEEASDGA